MFPVRFKWFPKFTFLHLSVSCTFKNENFASHSKLASGLRGLFYGDAGLPGTRLFRDCWYGNLAQTSANGQRPLLTERKPAWACDLLLTFFFRIFQINACIIIYIENAFHTANDYIYHYYSNKMHQRLWGVNTYLDCERSTAIIYRHCGIQRELQRYNFE
jgi:hypothetical protein